MSSCCFGHVVKWIAPISIGGSFLNLLLIMCFVYIIESLKDGSFYIGRTADLKERLIWHNSEELNQGITGRKIPWKYFFTLEVETARIAGKIENHIKIMKSREYIRNLAKYPEIGERLIKKYS